MGLHTHIQHTCICTQMYTLPTITQHKMKKMVPRFSPLSSFNPEKMETWRVIEVKYPERQNQLRFRDPYGRILFCEGSFLAKLEDDDSNRTTFEGWLKEGEIRMLAALLGYPREVGSTHRNLKTWACLSLLNIGRLLAHYWRFWGNANGRRESLYSHSWQSRNIVNFV